MTDFAVRPANVKDWAFILQSWTRTYARSMDPGPLAPRALADAVHASITRLLSRPGVEVAVATKHANDFHIYGYVVYERRADGPVLHWAYVKEMYRGYGIGSDLVTYARGGLPGPLRITFKTPAAARIAPDAEYAPRLARPQGQNDHQRKA